MNTQLNAKTKTVKSFLVLGAGMVLNMLFGVLTTPVITRLVSPDHYGNYSLFVMYADIVMAIVGLGLDQTLVRFFYREENGTYRRKLIYSCWKLPVLLCLGCGAIAVLGIACFNGWLGDASPLATLGGEGSAEIPLLFALCTFFLLMNRYATLIVRLQYKSLIYSLLNILQKVFYVGLALLLILGVGDEARGFAHLALATTVSYFLVSLIGILIERRLWNPVGMRSYSLPYPTSELYRYGMPLILSSCVARLLQACGSTMLKWYCDDATVGIYSSAVNLVHLFAVIQTTFNTIWAPMMVEHYEKDKEDKSFYKKANQIITFILFLFGATMLVCKDIFAILLGEEYRSAALILPFLMFFPIMYTISETTNCGIVFMKKSHMNIWVSLAALVADAIVCALLIPPLGAVGAAIGTAVGYTVFYIMRTLIARRYYPVDYEMTRFVVVTVLFALFCLYGSFHGFDWLLLLFYAIFCAVLLFCYRGVIAEMISFGREFIASRRKKSL